MLEHTSWQTSDDNGNDLDEMNTDTTPDNKNGVEHVDNMSAKENVDEYVSEPRLFVGAPPPSKLQIHHAQLQASTSLINAIQAFKRLEYSPKTAESFEASAAIDMMDNINSLNVSFNSFSQHVIGFFKQELTAMDKIHQQKLQRNIEELEHEKNNNKLIKERYKYLEEQYDMFQHQVNRLQIDKKILEKKLFVAKEELNDLENKLVKQDKAKRVAEKRAERALIRAANFAKIKTIEQERREKAEKTSKRAIATAREALKYLFEYNTPDSNRLAEQLLGLSN